MTIINWMKINFIYFMRGQYRWKSVDPWMFLAPWIGANLLLFFFLFLILKIEQFLVYFECVMMRKTLNKIKLERKNTWREIREKGYRYWIKHMAIKNVQSHRTLLFTKKKKNTHVEPILNVYWMNIPLHNLTIKPWLQLPLNFELTWTYFRAILHICIVWCTSHWSLAF